MPCTLKTSCPYEEQCTDCIHKTGRNRKYKSTGLDTSDMTTYKREYMKRVREENLNEELKRLGLL